VGEEFLRLAREAEPQDRRNTTAEPAKWATAFHQSKSQRLGYCTLRALDFLTDHNLGFRFAPPQALCFHPLRGLQLIESFLKFVGQTHGTSGTKTN
jgi:hypothetical protein